ncbi:MAG: formamidopyrimidine-DNA glycosylase [Parcubacteria group bacterium Gr01-1014_3]|nr:MAG: formamidopyrimidine-DNA glycosylase [Parcubacteria group bacterium Gr01-1014_3]
MPELPEVQTVVNDLNKKVVGRKITGAWFDWPKMIKDPLDQSKNKVAHKHVAVFEKFLTGEKIVEAKRRAKNILIYLTHDKLLLVHQKMTGHMLVGKWRIKNKESGIKNQEVIPLEPKAMITDPYNKYVHLILYLDNGKMLALSDLRKFAKVIAGSVQEIENLPELTNLGPDALDPNLTVEKFGATLRQAQGKKIYQVLMDQQVIAGIGNIYANEILWLAKVYPLTPTYKLTTSQLKNLYRATRKILPRALKLRGTSTSDFRDTDGMKGKYGNELLVYQRGGEPCFRCKTKIKRVSMGGRSAHFCPKCQKA